MTPAYCDASAIVKLGHPEPESLDLIEYITERQTSLATSVIADVEVRRALHRLRSSGADVAEHVRGFFLLELTSDIRDRAAKVGTPLLRALDAIHVATALSVGRDLDFITYDDRLAAAARAEGLRVVQPGR